MHYSRPPQVKCFLIITALVIFLNTFDHFLQRFKQSMRSMQGALMIASVIPALAGFLGVWRIVTRSWLILKDYISSYCIRVEENV